MNSINNKIVLKIHKYGRFLHVFLFFWILWECDVHVNEFTFWGLVINVLFLMYFSFIEGATFGIKQTLKEITKDIEINNK